MYLVLFSYKNKQYCDRGYQDVELIQMVFLQINTQPHISYTTNIKSQWGKLLWVMNMSRSHSKCVSLKLRSLIFRQGHLWLCQKIYWPGAILIIVSCHYSWDDGPANTRHANLGTLLKNPTQGSFCMRPANERRRYNVTSSPTGWAHAQIDPCPPHSNPGRPTHENSELSILHNLTSTRLWVWRIRHSRLLQTMLPTAMIVIFWCNVALHCTTNCSTQFLFLSQSPHPVQGGSNEKQTTNSVPFLSMNISKYLWNFAGVI